MDHPRIGIALGSGSARGWAHIGVLKALAEYGIEPQIVAGSSIGAVVGAACASERLDDLQHFVEQLGWKEIVSYLDMSIMGGGLIQGDKLTDFFRRHLDGIHIEALPRQFAAVATDLHSGQEVWLQQGDLVEAVRASSALPGLFTPVKKDQRWLVDGGVVDPVPVSLCRAMGADTVIAVSLNSDIVGKHARRNGKKKAASKQPPSSELWQRISRQLEKSMFKQKNLLMSRLFGENLNTPGLIEVMAGSINIMQDRITRSRMAGDPPELLLTPRLSQLGLMEFDQGKLAIAEGEACVHRQRSAIMHLLGETQDD